MTARGTVLENTGELVHRLSSLCCSKKMPERVLCVCVQKWARVVKRLQGKPQTIWLPIN